MPLCLPTIANTRATMDMACAVCRPTDSFMEPVYKHIRYPDKTPSHNGPILCCTTPPPDEDCRWVSGPVLLGDVTGAELGNTVPLSHVLLCISLVPPSTRQCCLNTTLEWLLLPSYQSFAGSSSSPFQARNYKIIKLCKA